MAKDRTKDSRPAGSRVGEVRYRRKASGKETVELSLEQLDKLAIQTTVVKGGQYGSVVDIIFD